MCSENALRAEFSTAASKGQRRPALQPPLNPSGQPSRLPPSKVRKPPAPPRRVGGELLPESEVLKRERPA